MKSVFYTIALIVAFSLPLAGCGGGGAPGSTNSTQTDVLIKSAILTIASPDLDVNVHLCSGGKPEPGLFREPATLSVEATKLDPKNANYDPFPGSIEACTITYLKANEDPAAPIIEQMTQYPNCILVDGTTSCSITILDIQRKVDWWTAFNGGTNKPAEYPTHYIARMQCTYVTKYGKSGAFQTELDLWLADFNKC